MSPWPTAVIPSAVLAIVIGRSDDVEQILAPPSNTGDIEDDVGVHRVAGVRDAIGARGAVLFQLPAVSPGLNRSSNSSQGGTRRAGGTFNRELWEAVGGLLPVRVCYISRQYRIWSTYREMLQRSALASLSSTASFAAGRISRHIGAVVGVEKSRLYVEANVDLFWANCRPSRRRK
jgi:hypothetical protein